MPRAPKKPQANDRAVVWKAFGHDGVPPDDVKVVPPRYALEMLRDRHESLGDPLAPLQAFLIADELGLGVPAWATGHMRRAFWHLVHNRERLIGAGGAKKRAAERMAPIVLQALRFSTGRPGHAIAFGEVDRRERDKKLANEVALRLLPTAKTKVDGKEVPGYWVQVGDVRFAGGDRITAAVKETAARHIVTERTVWRAWDPHLAWQHQLELKKSRRATRCSGKYGESLQ